MKEKKAKLVRQSIVGAFGRIPIDLQDVLTLGGIGAAAYGASLIYLPAGFIVGGLLYASLGLLMAILQAGRGAEG